MKNLAQATKLVSHLILIEAREHSQRNAKIVQSEFLYKEGLEIPQIQEIITWLGTIPSDMRKDDIIHAFMNKFQEGISEEADKAMLAFGQFLNSYRHDFISVVWGGSTLEDHLQSKFNQYYAEEGAKDIIRKFYSELSQDNKSKLNSYIAANY